MKDADEESVRDLQPGITDALAPCGNPAPDARSKGELLMPHMETIASQSVTRRLTFDDRDHDDFEFRMGPVWLGLLL